MGSANCVKNFICVACPVGCALTVETGLNDTGDLKIIKIEGNNCQRGVNYAQNEITAPVRTFTSTIRVTGGTLPVCPVRSKTPLPLEKVFDVAREIAKISAKNSLNAPIAIGQTLIENICQTGINIIASRSITRAQQ